MARSTLAVGTPLQASSTGLSKTAEGGRFQLSIQFYSMVSIDPKIHTYTALNNLSDDYVNISVISLDYRNHIMNLQEEDFMFLWSDFLSKSTESLSNAAATTQKQMPG